MTNNDTDSADPPAEVVRQVSVGRSPHGIYTLDHAPRQ